MSKPARGRRWTGWLTRKPSILRPFPTLGVEQLEGRITPATTYTWTGGGSTANWSDPGNWSRSDPLASVTPTGDPANVETLAFPAGAAKPSNTNDLGGTPVFNAITLSTGYTLAGNPITLGIPGVSSSGSVVVDGPSNVLAMNTTLGASNGSAQTFLITAQSAGLEITGKLSGTTGAALTKDGPGTLTLSGDNSGFTGPIRVNNSAGLGGGPLVVKNEKALGDTTGTTTVAAGASLQILNGTATPFTIGENLVVSGFGVSDTGALLSLAGTTNWTGTVRLDADSAIGSAAPGGVGSVLNVTGVISDATSSNLRKEGAGEVRFAAANTYRGQTIVNNGVLTVTNALSLGAAGTPASGTVVNENQVGAGRLRIDAPAGIRIVGEQLTLNGDGQIGFFTSAVGALHNFAGDNTWAGPVILGSPSPDGSDVTIGAALSTNLIVSGVVSSANGTYVFNKRDLGRLIFNNANTYTGTTNVQQGFLTVRDSLALGATSAGTVVSNGATLELEVEAGFQSTPEFDQGRNLWDDSVTHDPHRLAVSEPLTISGRGAQGPTGGTGALRSKSGFNVYANTLVLSTAASEAAVGVDQDARPGHPTPDDTYFVADYSLTITGNISGNSATDFVKRNSGHLILPGTSSGTDGYSFLGNFLIEEGWVTATYASPAGPANTFRSSLGSRVSGIGETAQPTTTVFAGASLHVKAPAGTSLTFYEQLVLSGTGVTHPYGFIGGKGALVNLGGLNTWAGDISYVGASGIGVEQIDPSSPSDLVVTGSTADGTLVSSYTSPRNDQEFFSYLGVAAASGTVSIDYRMNTTSTLRVYYPPRALGGTKIYDSGPVLGPLTPPNPATATFTTPPIAFGPGTSNLIEIVVNEGGTATASDWILPAVRISATGGLVKFGSQRLSLQAEGTYSLGTEVREGTLTVENDSALGRSSTGTATGDQVYNETLTTVAAGAVLQVKGSVPAFSGGVAAGVQVWNERLVLNRAGFQVAVAGQANTHFTVSYGAQSTAPLLIGATAAELETEINTRLTGLTALVGPVTVVRSGNVFTLQLGVAHAADIDPALLTASSSDGGEVTVSGGNAPLVNLSDDNAWRGPVTLNEGTRVSVATGSRLSLLGPIDDRGNVLPTPPAEADLVKRGAGELILGGANTFRGTAYIDAGVVTAMHGQAFGATTHGTVVASSAQLQLQGNLTVSGEPLVVQGTGVPTVSGTDAPRWFNVGPAPTNNGVSAANKPTSGRITSVVTDPSDANVIYVATAGGGAWKSKDGGKTWVPLFDQTTAVLADGTAIDPSIFGGSIAVAPSDPRVVYFATGDANGGATGIPYSGQQDNYAGVGVYRSADSGRTWTLLTNPDGTNPLYGQAVSKVVVDPVRSDRIYVASGTTNVLNGSPTAVAGVWRYETANSASPSGTDGIVNGTWYNLVSDAMASPRRMVGGTPGLAPYNTAPPGNAGPDDDYRIRFPKTDGTETATWSDLQLIQRGTDPITGKALYTLYAALSDAAQTYFTGVGSQAVRNAVYRTDDPDTQFDADTVADIGTFETGAAVPQDVNRPTWWLGTGTLYPLHPTYGGTGITPADLRPTVGTFLTDSIPPPTNPPPPGRYGYIKIAAVRTATETYIPGPFNSVTNPNAFKRSGSATTVVYASATRKDTDPSGLKGDLYDIQRSLNSGNTWASIATPANPFGVPVVTGTTNVRPALGRYDHALVVSPTDPNTLYLGGLDFVFRSTNATNANTAAVTWATVPAGADGILPGEQFHALSIDSAGRLLTGSDAGVWRYDGASFTDLNGTLSVALLNSADPHPTDYTRMVAGAQDNGTQVYANNQAWARVDDTSTSLTVGQTGSVSGVVRYDPSNPLTVYAARDGVLRKSTNGGATWTTVTTVIPVTAVTSPASAYNQFPLVIDGITPSRILYGTTGNLVESPDGGATRISLNPNIAVTAIALAAFQGSFAADPSFPSVVDRLANTYDPNTIYVTDGTTVRVTKNRGTTWVTRTPANVTGGTITDLVVDPTNRDVVFLTVSRAAGQVAAGSPTTGRVFRSTDAGRTWTDISGNIPVLPTWRAALDPRTGTLYVGNDTGVYSLPDARTTGAPAWARFGAGMPNVPVRDLVLNQTTNTLTAATHGRGAFQLFLPGGSANGGAVRAASGASTWTGSVALSGNTVIGAAGSQDVQNGLAAASLNIIGVVSGAFDVTKVGGGTVILSGDNTYAGVTDVTEGVLQVNHPHALGSPAPAANTVVRSGAALELRSDLEAEPIDLYGNGFLFNGHYTGALRNVSNDNVYTGTLTFKTPTTIGVDSNSTLTIGTDPRYTGPGTIGDDGNNFGFDKESPGTLVLGSANTYGGVTRVVGGALRVRHARALGDGTGAADRTEVLDGGQLQIAAAADGTPTVVTTETLYLSGTGINSTGALLNTGGSNTWSSPIRFTSLPNVFPPTNPGSQIAIGVTNAADTLTIDIPAGGITEDATIAQFGLIKVGAGVLRLATANSYTGVTNVNEGAVQVADAGSLGPVASSEVQRLSVVRATSANPTYQLTVNGQTTTTIPAPTLTTPTDDAAIVQARLEALTSVGPGNVLVTETTGVSGKVFTITFRNALAGRNVPQIGVANAGVGLTVGVVTEQDGGQGTVVAAGASLQLEGNGLTVAEVLTINGSGAGNRGALNSASGANTYAGPVTLGSTASVGAADGATLTVNTLQDPTPIAVPQPTLRKLGLGTVVLPNANQYAGQTLVEEGVLQIRNALSLGTGRSEVQTVAVYGNSGTYTLSLFGGTTASINATDDAATVATRLNAVLAGFPASSGYSGASVGVAETAVPGGRVFRVTFGGTLADANVPQITLGTATGPQVVTATEADGFGAEAQAVDVTGLNGTFRLQVTTLTGAVVPTAFVPYNATAAQVEAALAAVVGAGNVRVTQAPIAGGTRYTVSFTGTYATVDLPPMVSVQTVDTTGAATVIISTLQDGPRGTTVGTGATLQTSGIAAMDSEIVTINGPGANDPVLGRLGALDDLSGDIAWNTELRLGSSASVGAHAGATITFTKPIRELGTGFDLDKAGAGTAVLQATGDSAYTGTTRVLDGTLELNHTGGQSVLGDLEVGDGTGAANSATLQELQSNQIADARSVLVKADGRFDLNGLTERFGALTVTGGTVFTYAGGAGGDLTTGPVDMTGGTVTVAASGTLTARAVGGSTPAAVTMRSGATITTGAGAAVNTGAVSADASTVALGQNATLTTNGNTVTLTNGALLSAAGSGSAPGAAVTTGAVSATASTIDLGANTTLNTGAGNLTLLAASQLAIGAGAAVTTRATTLDASNATVAANGSLATGGQTLSLDNGSTLKSVPATAKATVAAGAVTLDRASEITLGDLSVLTAGGAVSLDRASKLSVGSGAGTKIDAGSNTVDLKAGSSLTTGSNAALSSGNVTANASTISLGANNTVNIGNVTAGTSSITLGSAATLTAGTVTANATTISLGANSNSTAGDIGLTGGSLTTGTGAVLNAGNVSTDGGAVSLGTTSATTAGSVAATNGGSVAVGNGGSLTASGNLSLTASLLAVGGGATASVQAVSLDRGTATVAAGGALTANGDVTVFATGASTVSGAGTLRFGGAGDRTVSVGNSSANEDFKISTGLAATGAQRLVKTGAGRLTLAPPAGAGFPNAVLVQDGDLQVDTTTEAVQLQSATASLSGTGTVGRLTGSGTGGSAVGTVTPGVSYAAATGTLSTHTTGAVPGDVVWGAGTVFSVNLDADAHPNPTAGVAYDQLVVGGNVTLGGATLALSGALGGGVQLNDRFTIIRTVGGGTISGSFKEDYAANVVFLNGQKFQVQYLGDHVDLVKVLSVTTTVVTSSVNPSTLNQPVTFTATVTAEPGAGAIPTADTVTFFIDGNPVATVPVNASGVATYTPPAALLPGGSHAVSATFNGDNLNFAASTDALDTNQVVEVPAIGALVGSPPAISPNNSAGVNDALGVAATVTQERSTTNWTVRVYDGGNAVIRTITGTVLASSIPVNTFTINATWDGKTDGGAFAADGVYTVEMSFLDVWGNTGTTNRVSVTVDNTSPTSSASDLSTVVIAPGTPGTAPRKTATLSGTVGDTNLAGWTVTVKDSSGATVKVYSVTGTGTSVTATWDGTNTGGTRVPDGTYTMTLVAADTAGNTSAPLVKTVVVLTQPPVVTLTSGSPTVYGQTITLTATVALPAGTAAGATLLAGDPVNFYIGTGPGRTLLGSGNLVLVGGEYKVSIPLTGRGAGTYSNITAEYPASDDFLAAASAPLTHVVNPAPLRVTGGNGTKVYGQAVPALGYTVNTADLKYSDTASVVTGGVTVPVSAATPVGTYPVQQGSLAAGPNYTIVYTPGTFTVTKAPLTVRVDDATRPRFAPNPEFTARYEGLLFADGPDVVSNLNLTTRADSNTPVGQYDIFAGGTPTAQNYAVTVVPGVLTITPTPTAIAVGSGGGSPSVTVYNPNGTVRQTISMAGSGFDGGIRTASADFNKDGVADIVVGTGPGTDAQVRVLDGNTGEVLFVSYPFGGFTGGVFVAAGDITGDGVADLVITPDEGGGPRVIVHRGGDFSPLLSYFGIDDPDFRGGVRAAVGDINNDGYADVAVSAGFGGGPRMSLWDGKALSQLRFENLTGDFFVFEDVLRNGSYVAIGDVDGDNYGDLIVGAGPGGGPAVKIFSGRSLISSGPEATQSMATFFAGNPGNRGGVRVAAKALDGDSYIDVVTGDGAGGGSTTTAYRGRSLRFGKVEELFDIDLNGTMNGVFVG